MLYIQSMNRKKFVHITPEIARHVLDELAAGKTLTSICRGEDMPTPEAIVKLAARDPEFGEAYRFARRIGFELRGDMLMEKGERAIGLQSMAEVQGIRVSSDVDRWVMSRAHPELWGDHLTVEHHSYRTLRLAADHPDALDGHETTVIEGQGARIFLPDNSREVGPEIDGQDPDAA
jgi:hypothetical protein